MNKKTPTQKPAAGSMVDTSMELRNSRAKRLPAPQPGLVVTVPLRLLPDYLKLHSITPMKCKSNSGTLLVERVSEESETK